MALKNCFQVSSVSTPRVGFVQSHYCSFPSKEKLNLPTCTKAVRGLQFPKPSKNGRSSFVCKAGKAVDEVKVVTDSSWNDMVISSGTPVLVEFWAPWCGPCRMIAPVIDELAKEYAGKITCFKLNTDDCPSIATKYGIRSIPTVLVFKQGEKKESVIGAVPKSTLTSTIEKYID